jgi:hypothetical protein
MSRIEDSDLTIQELVLRKWDDEWDERLKAHIGRIAEEWAVPGGTSSWRTGTFSWMKSTRSGNERYPTARRVTILRDCLLFGESPFALYSGAVTFLRGSWTGVRVIKLTA